MLKWTVMARRDSTCKPEDSRPLPSEYPTPSRTSTPRTKSKRRRSSTSRRSSIHKRNSLDALEADKENQFTSTPIKSDNFLPFEALRDVSNLTPTLKEKSRDPYLDNHRIISSKKGKSEKKNQRTPFATPKHTQQKKKKQCISSHSDDFFQGDSQTSNYFRPFETVDSHIEGILPDEVYSCKKPTMLCVKKRVPDTYAPTLPTFSSDYSPCPMRTTHCLETLSRNSSKKLPPLAKLLEDENLPPSKKPKIDHVSDFLHQITFITSPDTIQPCFPNSPDKQLLQRDQVTPLVKKFLGFKFNKSKPNHNNNHNSSSFINNMSLDKIVDAILDSTDESIRPTVRRALNSGINETVDCDNEHNETLQENMMNLVQEQKNAIENVSENSSDSGFRSSTTENSHQLGSNFVCKCSTKKKQISVDDKTIIQVNETFNERCVDRAPATRKRPSSTMRDCETDVKKIILDTSQQENFTLKRQKCVRRKKPFSIEKSNLPYIGSPFLSSNTIDFESTPIRNCYMETKEIPGSTFRVETPTEISQGFRRCLVFDSSSKISESSSFSESLSTNKSSLMDVRGTMDLKIHSEGKHILVNVVRCKGLYRPNGEKINAYVKVSLSDRFWNSRRKRNAVYQRTAVQGDSTCPLFNHTFKLAVMEEDCQKRIHIEVWHRDRTLRTSEFLGCMSFDVKNAIAGGISGSFKLLPQSTGRTANVPITLDLLSCSLDENCQKETKMCESHSSVDELISLEDLESDLRKSTCRTALNEQQKYADENLFLRYLELDPTEGPDASSAATQRKATGNRNGRTPFTCTKRLTRPPKSGFGFSVVWTHPPRIERVEKGLPADKAGILPGDYIIFVDKHNVVMMPEIDILNLIRSYGSQLTLEIFRRNTSRNGSLPSVKRLSTALATSGTLGSSSALPVASLTSCTNLVQRRPSTVCSTNTTSVDYNRRKLYLPQVTFSAEKPSKNPEENRNRTMYQLINKEQQYATGLQFAVSRFVSALAERKDLITPAEHRILFQNCEEILRITEDILDHLNQEDGEPQLHLLIKIYHMKVHEITTAYKRYCSGIKKADCVLANKTKNSNSDFCRFLQVPQIPRRRPDITTFIHKPLEHYRDILRLLTTIQGSTKPNHDDFPVINQIVHDLQLTYREITSEGGLMEPLGEGRPLLTVQDLENRLVFTKCKPFVLNKPGRQWIFGGDLSRVEGRNVRQYWTLLFSDLLLFAKASRDRVLFVIEDPLPLSHITDMFFNVRKKDTEFRITINPEGETAKSPTVHCGPDLTRTPRKNSNKKTVILRAPNAELKAVWQNLLQRQIFQLNSGMDGSSVSSPLESPEAPITSSVVTLQSAESFSIRRQQTPQNLNQNCQSENNENKEIQKQIDALIELKCKQLGKTNSNGKYNAVHLEQWMKGQLNGESILGTPELEPMYEEWTREMVMKRSEELQLIDSQGNVKSKPDIIKDGYDMCEEVILSDHEHSPSKSTTTESQVTVRSSPLVPETVPVCRQCHKNCLSSNGTVNGSVQNFNDSNSNRTSNSQLETADKNENVGDEDDWQTFLLVGMMANPAASLVNIDPFYIPPVPKIAVEPSTPENSIIKVQDKSCQCQNQNHYTYNTSNLENVEQNHKEIAINEEEKSPDDSPETEEHPYHSLSSSVATLRRFGTVSSLERVASDERDDMMCQNNISDSEEENGLDEEYEDGDLEEEEERGIDNEAFNHSSIKHWTVRAGCFVAQKMAFFEKFGEDYRSGGLIDRYLRSPENHVNGDDQQEEETSGATSGEEIWGTPTSGGEMDDNLNSPSYEGKQSPNDGSISSDYGDDTEIMMDELLMTPPISGAIMRGLLPRRTLEPLIEEECSESSSTSSIDSTTDPSVSPEQGNETGNAADTCSVAVGSPMEQTDPNEINEREDHKLPTPPPAVILTPTEVAPKIHRSESYRHIIEAAENEGNEEQNTFFFSRFRPTAKYVNIERVPRFKSIKIFEFFNVRKPERRIYETFPEDRHLIKVFNKETEMDDVAPVYSQKPVSPMRLKDKQLDRRFWRQLSRRRGSKGNLPA
ncbi:protostome-specific GEF isoform X2 [Leptinotarsa decemlineata]